MCVAGILAGLFFCWCQTYTVRVFAFYCRLLIWCLSCGRSCSSRFPERGELPKRFPIVFSHTPRSIYPLSALVGEHRNVDTLLCMCNLTSDVVTCTPCFFAPWGTTSVGDPYPDQGLNWRLDVTLSPLERDHRCSHVRFGSWFWPQFVLKPRGLG
jgi:hypothetical protein